MCLILFAWQSHPRYSLVVAANRDEFHLRPSAAAQFWADEPEILAGRDLQAGGTWLGVTRSGRFAGITNYREPAAPELPLERSRGHLVRDFLAGENTPLDHARELVATGPAYRGYNLLLADSGSLVNVSNRYDEVIEIAPGVHGLSNHLLDTDWPKVRSGRERLQRLLQHERMKTDDLFDLITDKTKIPGEIPDQMESGLVPEQLMKHYFIVSPAYGTRSSTVVLLGRDRSIQFQERQFDPQGQMTDQRSFEF